MEKYKYGPLVYVTADMSGDEGNYYWTGTPPVGYDESGIPIDRYGYQCLDITCPLHPAWEPTETTFNEVLKWDIPTLDYTRQWFNDNFLIISDDQLKKYIIKWWSARAKRTNYRAYANVLHNYSSLEEIQEAVWQHEELK